MNNKPQRMKIETPIGSIESDSGSHLVDVISVAGIIVIYFIMKRLFGKWWDYLYLQYLNF